MTDVLQANEVARWYGQVVGLNDLSVAVGPGITGLLGPNGAGKTTFLRLVAGELAPSRGTLRVLGENPFANRELFRRIGFCPQQDALYDDMSGHAFCTYLLRLNGYGATEARDRATRAMERVGLQDAMHRATGGYSKGMRQRTRIAQSIAHDPQLIVFDEPLTGLDPIGRRATLALFRELAEEGRHLLVSSHVLHEVESLTENVVLIHRGRLLAQGSVPDIRELLARHPRRVEIQAREGRRLAAELMGLAEVESVKLDDEDRNLVIETRDVRAFFGHLTLLAAELRAGIESLESVDAGLESVFDYLVE